VTIGAEAGFNITNGSTPLTATGSNFNQFTGTTGLTYSIRTTASGGGGSITLKVTTDFSPGGGPSVGSPPTAGDARTYTSPARGRLAPARRPLPPSATFATNVHTGAGGSTASVNWSLTNDPKYKTGTYNATVTFTISAS
jgi:hypothetical protein